MDVGAALVDLALAHGRDAIAVVGTAKNVGKTVAFAAICDALERRETVAGVVAIGRDGEAVDALDAAPKPRLRLRAGTLLATAQALVGRHPALELVAESDETSALGRIVIARVRRTGTYEFAGPPTARGVRRIVDLLREHGARTVAIDGAIDRIAALRDGGEAIVVATGAASGATAERVAVAARLSVARLQLAPVDAARPRLRIDGALTANRASALLAAGELRQVVVRDPTRLALGGQLLAAVLDGLDLRCERPLTVVACTIASIGGERRLEPRGLLAAVADATGLPSFDVYAAAARQPLERRAS